MIDLDKLAELEKAATAGPWDWWTSCSYRRLTHDRQGDVIHAYVAHDGVPDLAVNDANMRLIADVRNVLPAIIAELRAARELAFQLRADGDYGRTLRSCELLDEYESARDGGK